MTKSLLAVTPKPLFVYNAWGEQIVRMSDAVTVVSLYDEAGHWIGDYGADGKPLRHVVWLEDHLVALVEGGRLYDIETGHLATPRRLIEHGTRKTSVATFDLSTCKQIDLDDVCIEQCLLSKFAGPRPRYGIPFERIARNGHTIRFSLVRRSVLVNDEWLHRWQLRGFYGFARLLQFSAFVCSDLELTSPIPSFL